MSDDSLKRPTAVDLLKRLLDNRDKNPPDETEPLQAKTDIYSVPATLRRITPRPRPVK